MKLTLIKTSKQALEPIDEDGLNWFTKVKDGALIFCDLVRPRNEKFHRKFFVMLDVAFGAWEPEVETYLPAERDGREGVYISGTNLERIPAVKDKESFREELIILAGFRDAVYYVDGGVRLKAKSISFASMDQDQFEELYSAVANVVLQKVLKTYSYDDLEQVVERVLRLC